jgi:esterase/lipase
VDDVATVVTLAKSPHPGLHTFLLGHSAGGVVSCLYTLDHQAELAGFVCESFAFQVPAPDFAIAALKGLSHLAPHAHVLRLKNEDFSRDPAVVKMMNEDPLIANEAQPTQTMAELARADDRLKREFPLITLPILILHGTADKATKPSGSQMFYDNAGTKDKTLKLYEGHDHHLLNDVGKESVFTDVVQWLEGRVPSVANSLERATTLLGTASSGRDFRRARRAARNGGRPGRSLARAGMTAARTRSNAALNERCKLAELGQVEIGDRPEARASMSPGKHVVTLPRVNRLGDGGVRCRGPHKEIDHVPAAPVGKRRDGAVPRIIQAATDKGEVTVFEIDDGGREIEFAGKPWLDRVLIGRRHVSQVVCHQ